MSFETKNPSSAKELLDSDQDWVYLDVRSTAEFEQGHPTGAYNVPLAQMHDGQMVPNAQFVEVVQKNFPADTRLVVGCAMGGRSARACEMLAAVGYQNLVNMHGGYSGARDPSGRVLEPGWKDCGFPTAVAPRPERGYAALL